MSRKTVDIEVDGIKTVNALVIMHGYIKSRKHKVLECNFTVRDKNTGHVWKNTGGFNNNPWDLWLVKNRTKGVQTRTFIRVSCGKDLKRAIEWALEYEGFKN